MEEKKTMRFSGSSTYIADDDLLQVTNIAMALGKPLVIKGEPGTGKTELAIAIAESLGMPLITWSIKSTTKAQDGLYHYDVVQRLYDSQLGEEGVDNIAQYIHLGKLGEAFSADEKVVLLIDEIDKADLEFPNDLLWELDKMEFYIPETHETVKAKESPIVIITSNAEKELPDAFLRRCVFHYIDFPDDVMMRRIVLAHYPDIEERLAAVGACCVLRRARDPRPAQEAQHERTARLDPRAALQRHRGVPHREGDPLRRRAAQEERGPRPSVP